MSGFFITFEGPEKSGKSTQARLLARYLTKKGFSCLFIREPGTTHIGEKIRRMLLDKRNDHLEHTTEMLLYMAARSQIVKEIIKPALQQNKVVICDRFLDSTIAYQGYGLGVERAWIQKIGAFATEGISPAVTLLLDMNESDSSFHTIINKDRIELRSRQFHARVRKGYFRLARQYPRRIKIVRVQKTIRATQQEIRRIIDQCLLKKS